MSGPALTPGELTKLVAALTKRVEALERAGVNGGAGGESGPPRGAIASDRDLDSEHGNPRIRFGLKVKYWPEQPDPHVGYSFSECGHEYLEAFAKYLDSYAYMLAQESTPDSIKKAKWKALDAARARGWAQRNKQRGAPAATPREEEEHYGDSSGFTSDDEIPF